MLPSGPVSRPDCLLYQIRQPGFMKNRPLTPQFHQFYVDKTQADLGTLEQRIRVPCGSREVGFGGYFLFPGRCYIEGGASHRCDALRRGCPVVMWRGRCQRRDRWEFAILLLWLPSFTAVSLPGSTVTSSRSAGTKEWYKSILFPSFNARGNSQPVYEYINYICSRSFSRPN
jgi:hypothetical protein